MMKVAKMMMTSPISTTSPISEIDAARRHLLKCRERLAEVRTLRSRISDTVDRMLVDLAIEDATTALLAALSWAWDTQHRARAIEMGGVPINVVQVERRPVIGYADGFPYHGKKPVPTYVPAS